MWSMGRYDHKTRKKNLSVKRLAFVERLHVRMHQLESAIRTHDARNKPAGAGLHSVRNVSGSAEKQKRNLAGPVRENRHKTRHAPLDDSCPRDNANQDNAIAIVTVGNF